MKRFFPILSVTLAALAGLGSCKVVEEPYQVDSQGLHSACFNGRVAELVDGTAETKGLSLVALPDWRKTAGPNIHLYENGTLGQNPQMTIDPEDNRVAHFTATFSGSGTQSYEYNAVIAPADESGAFVVPAVQHPDSEKIDGVEGSGVSLIDPDADFLIGKTITSDASYSSDKPVDLDFVRPVSLFRLAIVGLNKEEKVRKIALNTEETLTGEVALGDIDFKNGTANFDKTGGSSTVTLEYNDVNPRIIFYAYYVVCPTETKFNTLVVTTDKASYTKTFTSGSKVNFACGTFHSIAVDMSDAVREEAEPETTKFYKVKPGDIKAGKDYLIVSNGHALKNNNGSIADVAVTDVNGIIELENCDGLVWTSGTATKVDTDYPGYTYSNGGKKLNRKSSDLQLATPSDEKYYNFDYSGSEGSYTFMCGTHYYAYYSTSNSKWTNATSSKSTTLYCSEKPEDEPVVPPTEDSDYVLVKSASDITSGTYILAALSSSKYYFFDKSASGTYKSGDMTGYVVDDKIESNTTTDAYAVTITRSGDNLQINVPDKGYMYVNEDVIDFHSSAGNTESDHTISSVNSSTGDCKLGNKGNHSRTTYYFDYAGSSTGFRYSTNKTTSNQILLFKLDNGSTPTPPAPATVTYTKVSVNSGTLEAGTYLIVNKDSNRALSGTADGTNNYVTVAPSDDEISGDFSANEVTISVSGSNYTVKNASGEYLYCKTDQSGSFLGYRSSSNNFTLETSSEYTDRFYFRTSKSSSDSEYLYYDATNDRNYFKIGGSGKPKNDDKTKEAAAGVYLYKKAASGGEGGGQITPTSTSFNLENTYLTQYLDAAATSYTNGTTNSIVTTYTSSKSPRDLPNPVSLSWSGSATSISIYEGENTSGTAVKTQTFASSSTADIYNLIPGRTYSYKTSNGQTGTFNTTGRRRMIRVSDNASQNHARNCRDFGGIPTRSGKTLKYGLMYRGTNMDSVKDHADEIAVLKDELGIKLDQDLRGSSSSPIGVAISGNAYDSGTIASQDGDNMKKTVSDVLESVIKGEPVYIHCQIGSDRTGYMCMLYESLLGCEVKECDIDYEITSFANGVSGCGNRPRGDWNNKDFRSKFINKNINGKTYTANEVPEAVESYVVKTLGISLDTVKAFRKAMGVSETIS